MKNKKCYKLVYFLVILLILPMIGKASDVEIVGSTTSINLNKKRQAEITESFEIYYINSTSKFTRSIDKKLTIYREKESKSTTNAIISNVESDVSNTINKENKIDTITLDLLGKKDTIKTAQLSYTYDLGKDNSNKYDEFYYNIISNFDCVVSGVAFEIVLPEDTKVNNISFALNGEFNLNSDDVSYYVENNIITGYLNIMLNENDTFSVRLEFPNGYFENETNTFNSMTYLFLILPFLTLLVVIIYWFKYGFKNSVKSKITFYPPNNFDSAEIAYLYKGYVEEKDIVSLVLYLANKNYFKIEENDDGYKLGKANSFKFIKEREYDLRNASQKKIFNGIFKDRKISELSDIEYTVDDRLLDAKKVLDNKDNKIKLFNIDINKTKLISLFLIIISIVSLNIISIKEMGLSYLLVPVLSFAMIFALAIMLMLNIRGFSKIVIGFIILVASLYIGIQPLIGQNELLLIYGIGIVLTLISSFIYSKLPARTKFGNQKLGEAYGFKMTLQSMSQEKLKTLLKENPNYFYDMVPYAYVFDILDIWMNKGKGIITDAPSWHVTKEEFSLKKECSFFKNVIYTTTQIMVKGIYAKKESHQLEFKRDEINAKLNDL